MLHTAPGIPVTGGAELPHYLLMRAVSEIKEGRGRTALGTALTGAYSTLLESKEGRLLINAFKSGPEKLYVDLVRTMVGSEHDADHPKLKALVEEVYKRWERGEKILIFCFRVHTAKRLRDIIRERIHKTINEKRKALLGTENAFRNFRGRLTGRERDLIPVVLDRVLWSWCLRCLATGQRLPLRKADLQLHKVDFLSIARLAKEYAIDLEKDQVDRVFLHRAVEHSIACRLLRRKINAGQLTLLLKRIANLSWIEKPYGIDMVMPDKADIDEALSLQQKGVHNTYSVKRHPANEVDVKRLAKRLRDRENQARRSRARGLIGGVAASANLWLGSDPFSSLEARTFEESLLRLHDRLWQLTQDLEADDAWLERLHIFSAFRRAVLREATLIRLMSVRHERPMEVWAANLAEAVSRSMAYQTESFLHHLAVFVEDYAGVSGTAEDLSSSRGAMLNAALLRDDSMIALVEGSTQQRQRDRLFSGFNTPFVPDVLICTSVGQEGIDLHRHCRNVVHYDMPWNPAIMEQRTGRADRIGSKTFRERDIERKTGQPLSFLNVGVPYLAGTYDERIYEEVKVRAQIFEVLTGGSFAAEHVDNDGDRKDREGIHSALTAVQLPACIVDDLRVRLDL
jgi:hypothetical protein